MSATYPPPPTPPPHTRSPIGRCSMSVPLRHSTSQRLAFNLCPACLRMLRVPVTHPRFTQSTHPFGSSVPLSLHHGMLVVQDIYPVSCDTVTTSSTILSLSSLSVITRGGQITQRQKVRTNIVPWSGVLALATTACDLSAVLCTN